MKTRLPPSEILRKNSLLFGILLCIFLAAVYPKLGSKEGPLKTEISVKYGAVCLIFLISGLSLKTDTIFYTFQQYELHSFVQLFTFLFIPVCMQVLVKVLEIFGVNHWILKGLITVACMPPPVSSAVILTRAANGNETAAIFNSVLGSFLGIIVTPVLLLFNLGITTLVPLFGTLIQLTVTVLIPIVLGQLIRTYTSFRGHFLPLNAIGQGALLFVIYTTFCDTFMVPETGLSAPDVLLTVFLVLLVQMLFLFVCYAIALRFNKVFRAADVVTIMFCATHKSLTLGIPILRVMFHGFSHLSQISLPLLVYHPTQIILGGFLVGYLKQWVSSQKSKRPPV